MRALLLNSGIGKRMGSVTKDIPKCLVEIAPGESIIDRQVRVLQENGISEIVVTTGPFEDQLHSFFKQKYPHIQVTFIHNPNYKNTNYIYSMWLAREVLNRDILLMHGDLVLDFQICSRVIHFSEKNCVVMDKQAPLPEKDFKGRLIAGYVKEIGINVTGAGAYFLLPLYRLQKDAFNTWMQEIGRFVERNDNSVYAENAFNEISDIIHLKPLWMDGETCMEVDTYEDLEAARKLVKKNAKNS